MVKISELASLTVPSNDDEVAIVDTAGVITKKIRRDDLLDGAPLPANTVDTQSITDANVTTAKLADASVTPGKLATGAVSSTITTGEIRSNTSYGALTTAQAVTATIGANGLALVSISCGFSASNGAEVTYFSYAVSGANTIAVSDGTGVIARAYGSTGVIGSFGKTVLLTGLTAGSTTFTVQVRNTVGTTTYSNRNISVIPL